MFIKQRYKNKKQSPRINKHRRLNIADELAKRTEKQSFKSCLFL